MLAQKTIDLLSLTAAPTRSLEIHPNIRYVKTFTFHNLTKSWQIPVVPFKINVGLCFFQRSQKNG